MNEVSLRNPDSSSGRVVVVGTLNIDLVWSVSALPRPGQTVVATNTKRELGGKGANQAVAAARYGAPVALVGCVGADAEGALYRQRLEQEGISAGWMTEVEGATGAAHVYVDEAGENLIVVDRGANARLDRAKVQAALRALLPTASVVLLQQESPAEAVDAVLEETAAQGVRVILNASPMDPSFRWGKHAIDVVVVNEHECAQYFAHAPEALSAMDVGQRAALLRRHGVQNLVITQGAQPTLHLTAEAVRAVPVHPVQPVDTVGAGDTFAGVLAAELARGAAWERALRAANVAAALSTLALGAQAAMPTGAAVAQILQEAKDGLAG